MATSTSPRYGTLEAAAELLDVTPRTIRNFVSRGDLRAYRLGKRTIRVDLNEVEKLLRPIPTAAPDDAA